MATTWTTPGANWWRWAYRSSPKTREKPFNKEEI